MKEAWAGVMTLAAGLALSGCLESEVTRLEKAREEHLSLAESASQEHPRAVAEAALRHVQQIAQENPTGNFMISPFSVQECLGMVRMGAGGATNQELAGWLGAPSDAGPAGVQASEYRRTLSPLAMAGVFSTANGLWVKEGTAFKPDYLTRVKRDYEGEARSFSSAGQALKEVNAFVKEGTQGMIPKLLDDLDPAAEALLVNAVSFKDKWAVPFDRQKTTDRDFQTPAGVKKVPMMSGKKGFTAAEIEGVILGQGEFKTGLKITFALPPTIKQKPEMCFPHLLRAAREGVSEPAREFEIPRLKSEFKWDLKKTMMAMGVTKPFEPGADFSRMMDGGVFISDAFQKSFVEFDEEGVKAAAATVAVMTKSAPPRGNVSFVADRPFAYVIHDIKGMPLFLGVVRDPSLGGPE